MDAEEHQNQAPNTKQQTPKKLQGPELQNDGRAAGLGIWCFGFIWCLVFGVWCFPQWNCLEWSMGSATAHDRRQARSRWLVGGGLFMPERLHGVHLGGAHRGEDAEDDADEGGDAEGDDGRPE